MSKKWIEKFDCLRGVINNQDSKSMKTSKHPHQKMQSNNMFIKMSYLILWWNINEVFRFQTILKIIKIR